MADPKVLYVLAKVAFVRRVAESDDPHGIRHALGGAVGLGAGMPAVPGGQMVGSELAGFLADKAGKGMLDKAKWMTRGSTLGGAIPPAVLALLMSRAL